MSHVHVCLVSDQTIPNILSIHHFKPDTVLFITTKDMEKKKKTQAIIDTLKTLGHCDDQEYQQIEVLEDSILDCHLKIETILQKMDVDELTINLTGGTKIMSIAAYELFKDYGSKMIYIPISKNEFITPFPKKAHTRPETLSLRLSVIQYLTAYGLNTTTKPEKLERYKSEALKRRHLSEWIGMNYERVKSLLVWLGGNLREYRDKTEYTFQGDFKNPAVEEIDLIGQLGLMRSGDGLSKRMTRSEIRYITGGWLEEFCFCKLHRYLGNGIDNIQLGLTLKNTKEGTENEFDVMFTKDNALYLVECKTLDQHNLDYKDVLYKIGALQNDFGLRVKSFWVTTSPLILKHDELKPAVRARAEQFKTTIVPPQDVINFDKIVAKELQI